MKTKKGRLEGFIYNSDLDPESLLNGKQGLALVDSETGVRLVETVSCNNDLDRIFVLHDLWHIYRGGVSIWVENDPTMHTPDWAMV